MKNNERIEKQREQRVNIIAGLVFGFFLLVLMCLTMFGPAGIGDNIGNMFGNIKVVFIELIEVIWFKISNFLSFIFGK